MEKNSFDKEMSGNERANSSVSDDSPLEEDVPQRNEVVLEEIGGNPEQSQLQNKSKNGSENIPKNQQGPPSTFTNPPPDAPATKGSGHSFFSEDYKHHRRRLVKRFLLNNLMLCVFILAAFSIYWGSYYQRSSRYKNLKMLVVIEDDQTIEGVEPVFGNSMDQLLRSATAKEHGDWYIYSLTQFKKRADVNENSIEDEINRLIHHQEYWSSIHVLPNATYNYYNALKNGDSSYNVTANTVISRYETGRDFLNMQLYITPQVQAIEKLWLKEQPNMVSKIINSTIDINSASKIALLSLPLVFEFLDRAPFTDPVLVAPCQVGFIYMIILTFFVFNFFTEAHQIAAKSGVKKPHFMLYRYLSSILTYVIISLFFGLVTLAFQVDFTVTYGKSGFLVYWCIAFLTMCAVGLANEIMAMTLIMIHPPFLGCWMLSWVVINISPTFGPIALMNRFYRYGYAIPIHNSFEATKTVFFDVYKGQLGRNFGILIAWWAVLTLIFPFVVVLFGKTMAKRAQAAAKAEAEARARKQEEEKKGEKGQQGV
ncbi:hypothetical protein LELG_02022 [Lodderomyces elongisporus NRRL YB-4239]|uniref:DUF3533 domain-containing protein n=1 Tax=Lodderomyces elongisporus (strain ATCC 11503 / CBS 2605 / JCM 1781 / NBRC 1676 / NRRL YB-4239) TaxID=379508 RepID=A5DXD5_LODEL|nr:hypothetical protein LELG_02022 [Lodderomyces elongisporus NRRL YB-4239]